MTLPSWEEIDKQINISWEDIQEKLPQEKQEKKIGSQFGGNWGISDLIKKEEEKAEEKKKELLAIEDKKKRLQATYELFTTKEKKKKDIATKKLFGKRDTGFKLEKAPKGTFFDEIKKIFEAKPVEQIAKAQVSYNISQKTGVPIEEVHKNLDKITKDLGIRGIPTSEEFISAMFVFPVTAALISHPVTTGLGVAKFLALAEAENFAVSKLKKWDYKFGEGKGLKELLPEETSRLTKDIVDVADFIGKGLVIAKTDPKFMKIWKTFTEKISTEYKMPEKMYISGKKVKSIFQTGEKISKEESQLIRDLGLNASQYKNAIKKGIDIEIPASKITTITDRPYWAKIKGLFNIKSTTKTVVSRGGKVSPAKLMIEGKMEIPKAPVIEPKKPVSTGVKLSELGYKQVDIIQKGYDARIISSYDRAVMMFDYIEKGKSIPKELQEKYPTVKAELAKVKPAKPVIPEEKVIPKLKKVEKVVEPKEELKAKPKEPTTPKDLEAKREMLREHGVKEELLTDEFVKIAKITELPKADVTGEIVSEKLIEDLEKKWGKEVKLTKKEVLEKVEKPKAEVKEPTFVFPEIDIIDLGRLAGVTSDKGNRIGLDDKKSIKHNLAALAHEVGHAVDNQFNLRNDEEIVAEFNMESDVEAKEMNRKEAIAEAIHQIVDDNETVKKQHPKLVEFLEKNIPDLKSQINSAREDFANEVKIEEPPKVPPTPPVIPKEDKEFIDKGIEDKKEFLEKLKVEPKAPEKLVSPEGTVTGEKGSMYIPSMAEVQNIATKIASKLSIEAPFIKAGAKETGFQVKNYYSNIGLAHEQALKEINILNKFNFKASVTQESGFKASGEIDYTDITYLTERPGYFVKLTPAERKVVSPAKRSIKEFYKEWEDKLRKIGWLEEPFPKSLITRNNRTIGDLKLSLPRMKTPEAKAKVKAEIERLTKQNERIKRQKIQFVSIPAKLILAKADTDPDMRQKIMSILPHWGRKTITVKDLVEAGIMTRKEADIRYIIGEYSDRMGRKYALGKIFENAEKEGLIQSQAEKPDWATPRIYIKGQHVSIPQLRGKRLDPFFSDVITDFFNVGEPILGGAFGVAKMLQFLNPLFMPMYDVQESAAAGMIATLKAPKYIAQGIKDSVKKTDNYWLAYENGTFSKPFVIPYDKWEYQFTEATKENKLGDFLKKATLPTNWIPMAYTASWHTAWKLDKTIRMMTFNYLQDKGLSNREAGQLTALFHSDYASVPPKTRKFLNKAFFTPTFKITMGKLYLNMFKGIGNLVKNKKVNTTDKILARGAWLALAMMMGISAYFKSQGYEEVEKFRKYVKEVETDEGTKENVITLSNPFNIPWRYYYRIKGAFKPQTLNIAKKLVNTAKWDLHPIWRVAYDVVDNYNWNIYNDFDNLDKKLLDISFYIMGEIIKITKGILESAREGEIKADAFKALQKDLGQLQAIILKPFIFNYLREVKSKRGIWLIQKVRKNFGLMMLINPSKDPKVNYERLKNYNERLQEIQKEFF